MFNNSVFLFVCLTTLGIFISCFIKLSVQTSQPIIVIYRRGNCVYPDWGCIINLSLYISRFKLIKSPYCSKQKLLNYMFSEFDHISFLRVGMIEKINPKIQVKTFSSNMFYILNSRYQLLRSQTQGKSVGEEEQPKTTPGYLLSFPQKCFHSNRYFKRY